MVCSHEHVVHFEYRDREVHSFFADCLDCGAHIYEQSYAITDTSEVAIPRRPDGERVERQVGSTQ